jgi:hypothetical protein
VRIDAGLSERVWIKQHFYLYHFYLEEGVKFTKVCKEWLIIKIIQSV